MKVLLSTQDGVSKSKIIKRKKKKKSVVLKIGKKKTKKVAAVEPVDNGGDDDGEYEVSSNQLLGRIHSDQTYPRYKRLLITRRKKAKHCIAFAGRDTHQTPILGYQQLS